MGSNVVRLVRSDHRKIRALLERAAGPHRNAERLREEIVANIRAHAEATSLELLPYYQQRLAPEPDRVDRHRGILESLAETATDLGSLADGDRAVLGHLDSLMREHMRSEDQEILDPMDRSVDVIRLRRLGEMFRRRRDAELKSSVGARRRLRRPDASRAELYERARRQRIEGRSKMTKAQLREALREGGAS